MFGYMDGKKDSNKRWKPDEIQDEPNGTNEGKTLADRGTLSCGHFVRALIKFILPTQLTAT